ncbi:LPXTG cell wall anchor domain-containing protein [Phytohabitans suffuscus]|uniref:Gram-positive cocci surface proteins LPxTG domain-containing protein n=1 Tax=Phytohabitans suffuscus TaxID=624315 RepID=A0A6F8YFE2_9ACTN|nr:LPXTG cell wall anchor domain-containing protein [Phytohabitans suffuscus]BCB84816.1 hypothetical protein Psuf_021290 [Phytohabitans suffuscus]
MTRTTPCSRRLRLAFVASVAFAGAVTLSPPAGAQPAATPTAAPTATPAATPSAAEPSTVEPSTAEPTAVEPSTAPSPSEEVARVAAAACPAVTTGLAASARVGGTIRLSGAGWCHPSDGGSTIAVKINDGAYSHLPGQGPNANLTVWQVVQAGADGAFAVDVQLPTATDSTPAFTPGSYTLRLLTGTLKAGDTIRSVETTAFTVTAAGGDPGADEPPGRPTGVPDPYDADEDLTQAARGGVTVTRGGATLRVTVPSAAAGDWVFLYAYAGSSPRPLGWSALDSGRTATASLSGVDVTEGTHKLAVLDRDGELLGWDDFTIAAGEQLPRTGPETYRAALIGGLFLLAGCAAVASTRRRLFRAGEG